ncbi:TetR family transcriptional regulator [Actibacterium mucosum KCTC 23349]|uniref:TetR family transcriptional regulator n=1 Tax=Actibacterium mucosum KCTC 23349 TaxID=1454373 RepID=A0A037ZQ91_9RHOB|nr:TetR/AcrR family transcriptional regulator [Actibacterium mucosum]KAJ57002.1 TetR family transcriptional regulator [Actibacterium mucosum KCTC 23349]
MDVAIKKGRKFDQVLEGAREVFLKEGFEGASVDDIAKAAGVSKATLYSYFPDKRLLFAEVARVECERQADQVMVLIGTDIPADQALRMAGERIMCFLTSQLGITVLTLCAAESKRFPELGKQFYESGPGLVSERLTRYLTEAVEAGQLKIDNIPLAADQFAELCKTRIFARILTGVQTEFSDTERQEIVEGAVDLFMARYGA